MLIYVIGAVAAFAAWKYYGGGAGGGADAKIQIFEPQVAAAVLRDLSLYTFEVVTTKEEGDRKMSRVKLTFAGPPVDQMDQMSRALWWAIGMNASGNAILGPVAMPTEAVFGMRDKTTGQPAGSWSPNTAQLLAVPANDLAGVTSMAHSGAPWAVIVRVANKLTKFTYGLASVDQIKAEDVV